MSILCNIVSVIFPLGLSSERLLHAENLFFPIRQELSCIKESFLFASGSLLTVYKSSKKMKEGFDHFVFEALSVLKNGYMPNWHKIV